MNIMNGLTQNTLSHKVSGYSIIYISLKSANHPPGDISSQQMRELSKISENFSFSEIRVTHEQNLSSPACRK